MTRLPRLIVAVVLIAASVAVYGDAADDDFAEAVKWYYRGNLENAARLLRKAISEKGQESDRLVPLQQSAQFLAYRPHTFLAATLARQGRPCQEIRPELDAAHLTKLPPEVLQVVQAAQQKCPAVVAQQPPPIPRPQVTDTSATLSPVATQSTPPPQPVTIPVTTTHPAAITNPPPKLADAIKTYVNGNYNATINTLEPLKADPPYDALVVLLRGASHYMQAVAAGDKHPELKARNDLVAYKKLNPKAAILDERLFNPNFLKAVKQAQ